jgi:enamine deaminase RidA (YjgF/YER057c/UK114 family)
MVMEKEIINPPSLARPVGFSHGIVMTGGRLLFLAGQTGSDAAGRIIAPGDIVAQYEQIMRNLQVVVEAAGGRMQDITKLNIFVRDRDSYLAHLKQLGQVHRSFFGAYYPAMALFEISRFYQDDALIEIEGMAVIDQ